MNDPNKVRLKISQVHSQYDAQRHKQILAHSQHGTQLLVRSQHGAQTWLGSSPTPAIFFVSNSNFYFNLQINIKAQPVNMNLAKSHTLNFHPKIL